MYCGPFFRDNPRLAKTLADLAAVVIQAQVSAKYGLRVGVIAILHTFNGKLEFNSHVHTMVTGGGLHGPSSTWVCRVSYNRDRLMESWRKSVIKGGEPPAIGMDLKNKLTLPSNLVLLGISEVDPK